jgi:ketosteroid isomerase-like protein
VIESPAVAKLPLAPLAALALTLSAALALALPACGGGDDKEDIEQTVRDFVSATNDRDAEAFCGELVTQEFLEQSTGAKGDEAEDECKRQLEAIKGLEAELVEIRRTEVDGDSATVRAVIEVQGDVTPQTLRLQKEDGRWKLTGGGGGGD